MTPASLQQAREQALTALRSRKLDEARSWLDQALSINFEDKLTMNLLKGIGFWEDRFGKLNNCVSDFDRANAVISYWKSFQQFLDRNKIDDEQSLFSFRTCIFNTALSYLQSYNNAEGSRNPDILWRVGLCNKLLGNFDASRKFLEAAWRLDPENPVILAELADIHALLENDELGKLLFREAFFLDPKAIMLDTLESALIRGVIQNVQNQGLPAAQVPYWIPIFGILGGVFTITRELKPLEYGKLKQGIYAIEREYQEPKADKAILLPTLLNKYFWLLDHAVGSQQPKHVISDILLKIESLHPVIYKLYTR